VTRFFCVFRVSDMPSRLSLALVLALAAAPVFAHAQSVDTLAVAPGARLRIATRTAPVPFGATLVHQTRDGLVVDPPCATCTGDSMIAWSALQTVDVRAGRRHGVKGALVGTGIGLLAGTLIAAVAVHQDTQDCKSNGEEFCGLVVLAIPAIALTGGAVGLVTGFAVGTQRWERVWAGRR
jgi:hypothetical protein